MTFESILNNRNWNDVLDRIHACSGQDVASALEHPRPGSGNLAALLSPAAEPFLERMARKAHRITRHRFGRVVQLYAPLYLSNECTNACLYCGFSRNHEVRRRTLTTEEALDEAELLIGEGFRHLLLVSGESPKHVNTPYLERIVSRLKGRLASIAIEVQPLPEADYRRLAAQGVDSLVSYQETYHREAYAAFHPRGPKRDFSFRLGTADRGGAAGLRKVGIGALLGLCPWRAEAFMLGLHAAYLQKRYWRTQVTVSFPRLCHAFGGFRPEHPVDDRSLAQMICALRIFLPDCGLVLSTREPASLRENLLPLGITQMSAGSRTEPGGYGRAGGAEGQFEVHDARSPAEVAGAVQRLGYEPVWKDWDAAFIAEEEKERAAESEDPS